MMAKPDTHKIINALAASDLVKLNGRAGTGKTTIINDLVSTLQGRIIVCAPTNQAARVLRSKGIHATTIHSKFYRVVPIPGAVAEPVPKVLMDSVTNAPLMNADGTCRTIITYEIPCDFMFDGSNFSQSDICIVDEASMVTSDLWYNLIMDFPGKVVMVGDENQLKPWESNQAKTVTACVDLFHKSAADVTLTKIHRQSAGSGIIDYATSILEARQTRKETYQNYPEGNKDVAVTESKIAWKKRPKQDNDIITDLAISEGHKIIAWKREDVAEINSLVRTRKYNFTQQKVSNYIPKLNEEIYVEASFQHGTGIKILKGSILKVISIYNMSSEGLFFIDAEDIDSKQVYMAVPMNIRSWADDVLLKPLKLKTTKVNTLKADYCYAITCNKSQGGQWDNVLIVDSGYCFDLSNWRYTAVTRASKGVIIMAYGNGI